MDTKTENKSVFALTILVGTSVMCVAFLVSRDKIYLKWCQMKQDQMKMLYYCLLHTLLLCMLGWFLYFWIALSPRSLMSETSHNKSSLTLMLSSFTILLKKAFSFSAISISDDMMLLLSTSVMFSIVFTFPEKRSLTVFQNVLLSLTCLC